MQGFQVVVAPVAFDAISQMRLALILLKERMVHVIDGDARRTRRCSWNSASWNARRPGRRGMTLSGVSEEHGFIGAVPSDPTRGADTPLVDPANDPRWRALR